MSDEKLFAYEVSAVFEVVASSEEEAKENFNSGMGDLIDIVDVYELYEV